MRLRNESECKRYIAIKKSAYILLHLKEKAFEKEDSEKNRLLDDYESQKLLLENELVDDEKKIFLNTLEFPYDVELSRTLFQIKSDYEKFVSVQHEFNLSDQLFADKYNEYLAYSFNKLINSGVDSDFNYYASSFVFKKDLANKVCESTDVKK